MKYLNSYLLLIIFFILADTICDNLIVQAFNTQLFALQTILILSLLAAQILISPIQAGLSDFYCRKKSLVVSLSFSFFSLGVVYLFDLNLLAGLFPFLIMIFLKGFLGNTIPIAWAAVADMKPKELRFSLALATTPYAIGYLLLNLFNDGFNPLESSLVSLVSYLVLILLCIFFFYDKRDKKRAPSGEKVHLLREMKFEVFSIFQDLKNKKITTGLIAYLMWSISLYSILVILVDFKTPFPNTAMIMMYGYLLGVLVLKFARKIRDDTIITWGYFISLVPLIIFFILYPFLRSIYLAFTISFFFHGVGNAFLSPAILVILSREKHIHEQGKIFGLIESADTLGFLAAVVVILLFKLLKLQILYLIIFSSVVFLLSWIPFAANKKMRQEAPPLV